ncbi:hypothetical protein [Natrinema sp. 74]|uniref:hypothetical protein n=1 Tax=Natrinema sp. 74 TaxID=3384159 RepID=UPI0038D4CC95
MHDGTDDPNVSRRALLRAVTGTVALSTVGTAQADGDGGGLDVAGGLDGGCEETSLEPAMTPCSGTTAAGCTDDHPATVSIRAAVSEHLERQFPDVGTLVDAGFKPYFDTLETGDDSWSHWLSPSFIGDDEILNPERPESVLVDNESWRSLGVMFIATRGGEAVEPPAVYDEEDGDRCAPWHAHTGLPGRFAWWYYQQAYEGEFGDGQLDIPCRTPCMLHVWAVDHPDGVYAHDAPPSAYRDLPPADDPGFETDAVPGEDDLGWDALPDDLVPDLTPNEVALPDPFGLDLWS